MHVHLLQDSLDTYVKVKQCKAERRSLVSLVQASLKVGNHHGQGRWNVEPGALYPLRVEVFLDGPGNVAESILECFCRFTVPNVYIHICMQLYVYN